MLTYLFAILAAGANATSSVLQRKAHRDEPVAGSLSWQVLRVLRKPVWLLGFLAVIAGFVLQAAALSFGALSIVEPVLVIELPLTLLIASFAFRQRLRARDWTAALAMTAGVSLLLYALSPTEHGGQTPSALDWWIGLPVNLAGIGLLVWLSHVSTTQRAAVLLGIATGSAFGLTVSLMKAMTDALSRHGLTGVLTAWQTYGMIVVGALSMFLLQAALNAGSLVAAQPGITIADPLISVLWGIFGYGETIRTGAYLALALLAAGVLSAGVYGVARSHVVADVAGPDQ